ncbi:unnamed protein product [Phyllotreta striolata]|uniref:Coiled-coil domain-containing protein 51 n=1 Tax=Phyllotreta striolata TaxID=444603 RepID=A0A9N9TU10_PHYSR|nr:unnamed protein product [Phyllotreta striolata]
MRFSLVLRVINKDQIDNLKMVVDKVKSEAPQYLSKIKQEQQKIVYDKLNHLNKWYTKIIGLDEVKVYQERVTGLQEQLLQAQAKRREVNKHLTEIRQKSQEIQSQIQHVDRKEKFDVYCQLINDERSVLNMERSASNTFQEYDQLERELFTAFTNAIRDSQEKQRAQLEYSKYIGVTLSLLGSFLAFVYTFFWKHDLKKYIHQEISSLQPASTATVNIRKEVEPMLNALRKEIILNIKKPAVIKYELPTNEQLNSNVWMYAIGGAATCALLGILIKSF